MRSLGRIVAAKPSTPSRKACCCCRLFVSGARGTRTPDLLGAIQRRRDVTGAEGQEIARDYGRFGIQFVDRGVPVRNRMYPFGTRGCGAVVMRYLVTRSGAGRRLSSEGSCFLTERSPSTGRSSTPDPVTPRTGVAGSGVSQRQAALELRSSPRAAAAAASWLTGRGFPIESRSEPDRSRDRGARPYGPTGRPSAAHRCHVASRGTRNRSRSRARASKRHPHRCVSVERDRALRRQHSDTGRAKCRHSIAGGRRGRDDRSRGMRSSGASRKPEQPHCCVWAIPQVGARRPAIGGRLLLSASMIAVDPSQRRGRVASLLLASTSSGSTDAGERGCVSGAWLLRRPRVGVSVFGEVAFG
jgi:hypothetical protein